MVAKLPAAAAPRGWQWRVPSSQPVLAAPWAPPIDPHVDLGVLHPRPVPRVKPRGPAVTAQCEEVGNHGSALVTRAALC